MTWQLQHHRGFVPAYMSTMRHAPLYDAQQVWLRLGRLLASRRREDGSSKVSPGLRSGKVLLVIGADDQVVIKDELIVDANEALGEDGFEIPVLKGGHEIAMTKGEEVAEIAVRFWHYVARS